MTRQPLTVAVVGATGVVGRTMIQVLAEREFPVGELRLLASGRSAGRTRQRRRPDRSRSARPSRRRSRASTSRCSAPAAPSPSILAPEAARARRDGHRQLERMADGPGRPARRLAGQPGRRRGPRGHHRQPELLDDAARPGAHGPPRRGRARAGHRRHLPERVSGTGAEAIAELEEQVRGHVAGEPPTTPSVYPHPIAFNALPEIDVFRDDGYTKEEWKVIVREPQDPPPAGPAGSLHGRPHPGLRQPLGGGPRRDARPDHARTRPRACSPPCPASSSQDDPASHVYPLATEAAGRDEIFVGRVRQDALDRRRPRARLLGRLGQPPQGRRDERRRDRRDPRRRGGWIGVRRPRRAAVGSAA